MSEYLDYLRELFQEFGPVSARRMFGGHGIFFDGLMIGLVADDTLYLKADEQSAPKFAEQELPRFEYSKRGKPVSMSYYLAPAEALEDPAAMREWAELAYQAALRSRSRS